MSDHIPIRSSVKGDPTTGERLAEIIAQTTRPMSITCEDQVTMLRERDVANLVAAVVDLQRRLREATACDVLQAPDRYEDEGYDDD